MWKSSVSNMIKNLNLHLPTTRRKFIRLNIFHKIKNGITDLKMEDHIHPVQAPTGMATRSYHPDNYFIPHGTTTSLANTFFYKIAGGTGIHYHTV